MESAGAAARTADSRFAADMLAWARTELAGAYLFPVQTLRGNFGDFVEAEPTLRSRTFSTPRRNSS